MDFCTEPRFLLQRLHLREELPHAQGGDCLVRRERDARVVDVDEADLARLHRIFRINPSPGRAFERLVGDHRRPFSRHQRHRVEARRPGVRVEPRLVAEDVDESDRIAAPAHRHLVHSVRVAVVGADEVLLAERPRRRIRAAVAVAESVLLRLGKRLFRRDAADGAHLAVVWHRGINHDERTSRPAMVWRGGGDVLARTRNLADVHLHPGRGFRVDARVAVQLARVASIGETRPCVVRLAGTAIDVVPARVDDHAVVVHARMPLVRLVVREAHDVRAVVEHRVEREGRYGTISRAAHVAATPLGDERDSPVRQPARIKLVPRPAGELAQVRAVEVAREHVVACAVLPLVELAVVLHGGERDAPAVPVDVRRNNRAAVEGLPLPRARLDYLAGEDVARDRLLGERVFQDVESVATRDAVLRAVEAVVLVAHVRTVAPLVETARLVRDEEQSVNSLE